jgi:hypothetical protein
MTNVTEVAKYEVWISNEWDLPDGKTLVAELDFVTYGKWKVVYTIDGDEMAEFIFDAVHEETARHIFNDNAEDWGMDTWADEADWSPMDNGD